MNRIDQGRLLHCSRLSLDGLAAQQPAEDGLPRGMAAGVGDRPNKRTRGVSLKANTVGGSEVEAIVRVPERPVNTLPSLSAIAF